jgi:hypothetical protein
MFFRFSAGLPLLFEASTEIQIVGGFEGYVVDSVERGGL